MEQKQVHRHCGSGHQLMMEQHNDSIFLMIDSSRARHLLRLTAEECLPHFSPEQLFQHLQNPNNYHLDLEGDRLAIGAVDGVGGHFSEVASFTLRATKNHQALKQVLTQSIEGQLQLSSNIQQRVHELIDLLTVRIANHGDASINEKENVDPQVHP